MVLIVALRKESVDRNGSSLPVFLLRGWSLSARRAWIEITVLVVMGAFVGYKSLSARRAWIEIIKFVNLRVLDGVALRKESVDRNTLLGTPDTWTEPSLSARRAWIEILAMMRKSISVMGRSPQGERG